MWENDLMSNIIEKRRLAKSELILVGDALLLLVFHQFNIAFVTLPCSNVNVLDLHFTNHSLSLTWGANAAFCVGGVSIAQWKNNGTEKTKGKVIITLIIAKTCQRVCLEKILNMFK